MRWLFWLLLLANLIFFSFIQWGELLTGENKNLKHQPLLNAEKIKLLDFLFFHSNSCFPLII